jgi:hypothetical protein
MTATPRGTLDPTRAHSDSPSGCASTTSTEVAMWSRL